MEQNDFETAIGQAPINNESTEQDNVSEQNVPETDFDSYGFYPDFAF
jgi:hypothetical protein